MPKLKAEAQHEKQVATLALLKLNNGNVNKTFKESGVSRSTIAKWVKANAPFAAELQRRKIEAAEKQGAILAEEADKVYTLTQEKLERVATQLLDLIEHKLLGTSDKSSIYQVAGAFGIVYDKLRTESGKANSISKIISDLPDEEKEKRVRDLLGKGRLRRLNAGGQPMALLVPENENNGTTG